MYDDDEDASTAFTRKIFSLEDVSPKIHDVARTNHAVFLKQIAQLGLETVGDRLHLHPSTISRMKDGGALLKMASTSAGIGIDILAMQEEIKELTRQNVALQVLVHAKLAKHLGIGGT